MLKSNRRDCQRAAERAYRTLQLVTWQIMTEHGSHRALELDSQIRRLVRGGYYEHFKSSAENPMFYLVRKVKQHVNYKDPHHRYQVDYTALYGRMKGRDALRELLGPDGFLTPIDRDGYTGPRFVYIGRRLPHRAKLRRKKKS